MTDTSTALPEAMAFIDMESTLGNPASRTHRYERRVQLLLAGLASALLKHGLQVSSIWAVSRASKIRPNKKGKLKEKELVSPHKQKVLTRIFEGHDAKLVWCTCIADKVMIAEVRKRLQDDSLPPVVVLLTNDGDFRGVAKEAITAGRRVLVVGRLVNEKWHKIAEVVPFSDCMPAELA